MGKLLEVARQKRTAIMCSEGLFWRCHRRLVSDFLVANGVLVGHVMPTGELRPHKVTEGAVIEGGQVTYPGENSRFHFRMSCFTIRSAVPPGKRKAGVIQR